MADTLNVGVEVLVDVPYMLDVGYLCLERLNGLMAAAEYALRASKDVTERVGKEHHVDLGIAELGAQYPVGLPLYSLVPQERPGRPVAVVFTH